jgi:hypothetical protein
LKVRKYAGEFLQGGIILMSTREIRGIIAILIAVMITTLPQAAMAAIPDTLSSISSFDLGDYGGSVVTYSPPNNLRGEEVSTATDTTEAEQPPHHRNINLVAETGTPVQIIEAPRAQWQPRSGKKMDFVRVSVEYTPGNSRLTPYVAVGRWQNVNREYIADQLTPRNTTFAVVGIGLRSKKNPSANMVTFQGNVSIGRTWNRDQRRTSSARIIEGQVSASYHVTNRLAVRVGYAHYSTGEGNIFRGNPAGYLNRGEGRLTAGITLRA